MFLNCNYPNECKIPKGKPKGVRFGLEMKKGPVRLFVDQQKNVWFMKDHYYWGIELSRFIRKTIFGVNVFETIGAINLALLDWEEGRGNKYAQLGRDEEDLLQLYLKTL